jgi:hypothetical protein
MSSFFFVFLSAVALAAFAVRPDSPNAKTRHQISQTLREIGWVRVIGWSVVAIAGAFVLPLITPARIGLHGLLVAVAGGASWTAARIAIKRHTLVQHPLELL